MEAYVTLRAGAVYEHSTNGSRYRCLSSAGHDARLERLGDGWTITAHGVRMSDEGKIHWNYSTGGHWPNGWPANFIGRA